MLRKVAVFIAQSVLTFLLFTTATTAVLVLTLTPAHLKSWLRGSNVYSTIVDDVLKQSKDTLAKNTGDENATNLPAVQDAAKKAFSPEFLQNATEQFIDGVTPWLDGKVDQPSFQIDVGGAKTAFINGVADHARSRYDSLPICAKGQIPDASDILSISCRISGVSIEPQIQEAVSELSSGKDFLPNQTITAANLTTGEGADKKPLFDQLQDVPEAYRWAHIAPFILGTLALGSAAIVVFASSERRKGIRRLVTSLGFVGIILLASLWLLAWGTDKASDELAKTASTNDGLQHTGLALIKEVEHTLSGNVMIFGITFLAIAAGLIIYLLLTGSKTPKPKDKEPSEPGSKTKTEGSKTAEPTPKPKLIQ
jgi:hypothetical protein